MEEIDKAFQKLKDMRKRLMDDDTSAGLAPLAQNELLRTVANIDGALVSIAAINLHQAMGLGAK